MATIQNIASIVKSNPPLENTEVKDIYSAIVVHFTSTIRKQNFISKFKEHKKIKRTSQQPQLNTQCLGLPGAIKPVFVSDHLNITTRHIFGEGAG